ncbi:unnamed protein product, partial [Allacma fusca]
MFFKIPLSIGIFLFAVCALGVFPTVVIGLPSRSSI